MERNHDVDNGNTQLTSPVFDATIYSNPTIEYYRWFVNTAGTGTPNDLMNFRHTNGTTTIALEQVSITSPGQGTWVPHAIPLTGLLPLTSTMQLIVDLPTMLRGMCWKADWIGSTLPDN